MSEAGQAGQVGQAERAERAEQPGSRPTLLSLLTLAGDFVVPGLAPGGADRPVSRLIVLDELEPPAAQGDLLVAVGVDPHTEEAVALVRRAGAAGAAGVLFRPVETGSGHEALGAAAAEAGTAVLFRSRWTDWPTVIGILHAGLSVPPEPRIAGVPLGDLPQLAKAIALQVGGSVTIEDMAYNVLAYSPIGQDVDWVRIWTILGQKPPANRRDDLRNAGFDRDLLRSDRVLHRKAQGEAPERLIVLVRAGDIPLGSIWVAAEGERPLDTPANREALRAAARAAVAHLLHDRARREGQDRLLLEAVRVLLDGQGSAELPAARTGLPMAERCAVLSVGAGPGGPQDVRARGGLVEAAFRHCSGRGEVSVVVPSTRGVLVLLGGLAKDPVRARERVGLLAESLAAELSRQLGLRVRVGIGEVQDRLDGAPESWRTAELALGGLLFGRNVPDVARVGEVADAVALLHFVEALRAARHLPVETPVTRLLASTRKGEVPLVDTLGAFLDQPGEKARAAEALGVARSTYAHRLDQTVVRESGIDLDDPDARLLAQLQLLLLRRSVADEG
ncbi:helix-turn-helix domain-containing protein [Kitasatospora sp. NPDC097691]|uniref:PucR family transcriptional regulator n=1 Tax=Kitasatospora sp. NPDC097691 TaxID=3157231 RepID=UPI003331B1CA